MKAKMKLGRLLLLLGTLMATLAPTNAFAHDNLGGDELAVANWMLIAALVVAVMGALAIIWAVRAGQFNNVEESKYTMLETAEDFDAIMAEADAEEARLAQLEEKRRAARVPTEGTVEAGPQKVGAGRAGASPAAIGERHVV